MTGFACQVVHNYGPWEVIATEGWVQIYQHNFGPALATCGHSMTINKSPGLIQLCATAQLVSSRRLSKLVRLGWFLVTPPPLSDLNAIRIHRSCLPAKKYLLLQFATYQLSTLCHSLLYAISITLCQPLLTCL